jgi:hypothetical protein
MAFRWHSAGAIAKVLACPWQRCTVHFLRDMLGHCAKAQQPMIATAIRLAGALLIEQNDEWRVGRRPDSIGVATLRASAHPLGYSQGAGPGIVCRLACRCCSSAGAATAARRGEVGD